MKNNQFFTKTEAALFFTGILLIFMPGILVRKHIIEPGFWSGVAAGMGVVMELYALIKAAIRAWTKKKDVNE